MNTPGSGASIRQLYKQGRLSQYLLLLACLAGVTGLLASRALVALSPIVGVLAACTNPQLRQQVPGWLRNQSAWWLALLYLQLLLSGLHTTAWGVWRHELYRQLPLLAVPLAFALAVPLTARQRAGVGAYFILGTTLVGIATTLRYWLYPKPADDLFGEGYNLEAITGIFHIHFSIMLALACYFGLLMGRRASHQLWRWVLFVAAASCLLVLHVLAYRTGLLVFYGTLLVDGVVLTFSGRHWRWGTLALVLLLLLPWGAYQALPALRERVAATQYDIEQFQLEQDINDYSLSKRLAAWQTAQVVARQHPWLGVGAADAYDAMMAQYSWRTYGLRPNNWVMIHNQYLHFLVAGGLVGLGIWLLVLLGPLAQPALRRNPYVYHFLLVQGFGMTVDSLLELQIGFNLFVFLYGFLLVASERWAHTQLKSIG